MSARPVLKWAGGKTKLIPEIAKFIPEKIGSYCEPFIGGGALFFSLGRTRFRDAQISDTNGELVNFYRVLRDSTSELIEVLRAPENAFVYKKENFYMWRAHRPEKLTPISRAARFLYLNRTCFNGLYRVNKSGQFNVPFGAYTNPTICDDAGLRAASDALAHVTIVELDFWGSCSALKKGDLVYFDPPYDPVSASASFTAYAKGGFQWGDQERLAEYASRMAARGVRVIASNADTVRIRKLWADLGFKIHEVKATRAINSSGEKRGAVSELIMVNP